ncbi:hypothetical protein D3C78_1710680 [compost metagenome]
MVESGEITVQTSVTAAQICKKMINCTFLARKRSDMRLKNSAPGTEAKATSAAEKPMATPSNPRSCCRKEGSQVTIM